MTPPPVTVSVIFSFRNEELVLKELIRRTVRVLSDLHLNYELLFINDASTDRSLEILEDLQKEMPSIKIISQPKRLGVAACWMIGFRQALGDAIITLDADLQDPPEVIPKLVSQWQDGAEVVHTVRTRRSGESWMKQFVTAVGYRIWQFFIPGNLLLNSGDFRLLSRTAVSEILKCQDPRPFFRIITRRLKLRQDLIYYKREKRFAGETHFSLLRSWAPFQTFFSAIFHYASDSLALLLTLSGLIGIFFGGVRNACWQVAVEGAQVLSGIVKYPEVTPFYMYQIKAWTLLHQLPALGLCLGLSEPTLSIILSALMGMLSFQALALSSYVFCRNIWISLLGCLVIFYTSAFNYGVNYPIFIMGTPATYGTIGFSFLFVALALLGAGRIRLGALMLGLSPAVHMTLGILGIGSVLFAGLMEWKKNASFRKQFFVFFGIGVALSAISYAWQWPLIKQIPAVDSKMAKDFLVMFARTWDAHRQPVTFSSPGVVINGSVLFLTLLWLRLFQKDISPSISFLLRIYQVSAFFAILAGILSGGNLTNMPVWYLALMSPRWLNLAVFAFPGLLLGLWFRVRKNITAQIVLILSLLPLGNRIFLFFVLFTSVQLIFDRRHEIEWKSSFQKLPAAFRILVLCLGIFLIMRGGQKMAAQTGHIRENWSCWRKDSFFKKVSEGKGLLLLGPEFYMHQMLTRRPVLIDGQALDAYAYVWEGVPETARILKEVYGVDFYAPPLEAYATAALPPGISNELWAKRSTEDWKKIRRNFHVTQILTTKDVPLQLSKTASNPSYDLYDIPE